MGRQKKRGRDGERENTFTTHAFSLEEVKLVWPRETNPLLAVRVRVSPSLSLVITI